MTVLAADVSNFQAADLSGLDLAGVGHLCVRLSTEDTAKRKVAVQQLQTARARGYSASGYLQPTKMTETDPVAQAKKAMAILGAAGVRLTCVWVACDSDPGTGSVGGWLGAVAVQIGYTFGYRVGIYTRKLWWDQYGPATGDFKDFPLWVAQWDEDPHLETVELFGAWTMAHGKQFSDSGGKLDRDVFLEGIA